MRADRNIIGLVLLSGVAFSVISACGKSKPKSTDANLAKTAAIAEEVAASNVDLSEFYWDSVKFEYLKPGIEELKDTSTNVAIKIESTEAPIGTTWSLYYNQSYLSPEAGTAIVEDQLVTATTVSWDTTEIERGTYFLFAILKYKTTQSIRYFGTGVAIENGEAENRTPFVSLTGVDTNTAYKAGDIISMDFLAADPDGTPLTFDIRYSPDDGATWTNIDTDLARDDEKFVENADTGQLTYEWTVPASLPQGTGYQIQVVGKDGEKEGIAGAGDNFGMITTDITYVGQLKTLFAAKCSNAGCHTAGGTPQGNLRLDYFDDTRFGVNAFQGFDSRDDEVLSRTRVDVDPADQMPPAGGLTQAERDLIALWNMDQGLGGNDKQVGAVLPGGTDNTITPPAPLQLILDPTPATETTAVISWNITAPAGDTTTTEFLWARGANSNDWTSLATGLTTIDTVNFPVSGTILGVVPVVGTQVDQIIRLRVISTTDNGRQRSTTMDVTFSLTTP